MFDFHEPGVLRDEDLELVLAEKFSGDPGLGFVPAYRFKMVIRGEEEEVGTIHLRIGSTPPLDLYFGNIGYRVAPEHRGHRYASRSIRLLLPLIQSHNLKPALEVTNGKTMNHNLQAPTASASTWSGRVGGEVAGVAQQ